MHCSLRFCGLALLLLAGSARAQLPSTNEIVAAVNSSGTRSITYEVVPGQPFDVTLWMLAGPLYAVLEGWGGSESSPDFGFYFDLDVQWTTPQPGSVTSIDFDPLPEMQPFTFNPNATFDDGYFHYFGRTSDGESIYCARGEQPFFTVRLQGEVQPGFIRLCPIVKNETGYRGSFRACSLAPAFLGYFLQAEQPCATIYFEAPGLPVESRTWSSVKGSFE